MSPRLIAVCQVGQTYAKIYGKFVRIIKNEGANIMSDIPQVELPGNNKENWDFFVFVIDGEVADQMAWEKTSRMSAILQSSPSIIMVPDNLKGTVIPGYTYVDGVFTPPVG